MKKYKVKLSDNYNSPEPFMVAWDYELIGDKLRVEFDEYFAKMEKEEGVFKGSTKRLLKGEELKVFMVRKKINLVDAGDKGLKSVFILKVGDTKTIDERAKGTLAKFEKRRTTDANGLSSSWLGFMEFEQIGGTDKDEKKKVEVEGEDVEYFEEEKKMYACDECGKEFDTEAKVRVHKLSHKKK